MVAFPLPHPSPEHETFIRILEIKGQREGESPKEILELLKVAGEQCNSAELSVSQQKQEL